MDPLTIAATAVVATVMTKALEKTGEKLGERVFDQSEKFLTSLRQKSPETALAIQRVSQEPLNFGRAILDVEVLAKEDAELANETKMLAAAAEEDPNPRLIEMIQSVVNTLKSQQPTVQNMGKLAEKIGLVVQGGNVSIENFTVD